MNIEELRQKQERASSVWRPAQEGEEKFYADLPMDRFVVGEGEGKSLLDASKVEGFAEKGDLITRGYGSTWVEDRDGEFVHPNAFDVSLPHFLSMNPIMLWQHDTDRPLGKFLDAAPDQYGLDMLGVVPAPKDREPDWKHLAYQSIAKGIVRTKSIGGYFRRMWDDESGKMWIREIDLMEVSIVSIPANPASIFEAAVKSVGGGGRRPRLTQQHIDQMMQILGAAPMIDPELRQMTDKQLRERYDYLAAYYTRCGKTAPDYEEWNELAKDVHSSQGLEGVRGGGLKVVAFIRKVQGHAPPDAKRGRAISSKNEDRLNKARDILTKAAAEADALVQEVLSSNDRNEASEEDTE